MNETTIPKRILSVLAVLAISACAGSQVFTGNGLFTGKPGANTYPEGEPGETQPLPRMYKNAPPMIPHTVADFTITRNGNDCLSCHQDGGELSPGHVATKVPESHYKNEHTGKVYKDRLSGMRYNCLQCHTPQSSKNPPVSLK